jgi:membrane-associated phospholipid phosphatase
LDCFLNTGKSVSTNNFEYAQNKINHILYRQMNLINLIKSFQPVRGEYVLAITVLLFSAWGISQVAESSSEIQREIVIEQIGDYGQFAPVATALLVTVLKKDKKGFWQLAKTAGTDLGVTWILKYAIDKPRPEGRTDGHAFPSGHTSFAFTGAAFLQRRYGWKFGIPAYALACFVGYSRVEGYNDRHDGWDVLAGAVVGIGSAYLFTSPYAREHLSLNAGKVHGGYALELNYKF